MKILDYINGPVTYDRDGTYLWIESKKNGQLMLGQIRGWGHLQHQFNDLNEAAKFQDEVGKLVAEAVNEKIARLKSNPESQGK